MTIGRFQVMAILQAARAYKLGLELHSAKSWGLNRAIFYAAAKRGFKGQKPAKRSRSAIKEHPITETPEAYHLGSEMAFKAPQEDGLLYFTIGEQVQTEAEFTRQIESRFQGSFDQAWDEALDYIRTFDESTLLSQSGFFNSVYKPKRDELATKWSKIVQ